MRTSRLQSILRVSLITALMAVSNLAIAQTPSPLTIEAGTADILGDSYHYEMQDPIGVKSLTDPNTGTVNGLDNIWDTNFIQFNNLDFGSYTNSITIRRTVARGARIDVWVDCIVDETNNSFSGGRKIGSYSWIYKDERVESRWETVQIPIATVGGSHNLLLAFHSDGASIPARNLGSLASVQLDRTIGVVSPTSITATKTTETLVVSDEVALSYDLAPTTTNPATLLWLVGSGDEFVSISQNGIARGVKAGNATVTVYSTTDPAISATFNITVVGTTTPIQTRFAFGDADILEDTYHWPGEGNVMVATTLTDTEKGESINGINRSWHTNYAVFKDVDFGNSSSKITLRRQAPRGGLVMFWADAIPSADKKTLSGGTFLGQIVYDYTKDRNDGRAWETRELTIPQTSGTHDIYALFFKAGTSTTEQDFGTWAWFEITQEEPNLYSITPSEENISLAVDEETDITLAFAPIVVDEKDVTWSVETGSDIASVVDGKIKGLKIGSAVVKATSVSNPAISATINVTVSQGTSINNGETSQTNVYIQNNELRIDTDATVNNIIVTDVSGRTIYSANQAIDTVDASTWANGVYFVLVNTDKGEVATKALKK